MKFRFYSFIIGVFLSGVLLSQSKPEILPINQKGEFLSPKVSPNGEFILVTDHENPGLYLLNAKSGELQLISQDPAATYGYSWNDNSEEFYFRELGKGQFISQSKVMTFDMKTGKVSENQYDLMVEFLPSFRGLNEQEENQIIVYVDSETFQIYAFDLMSRKSWDIANDLNAQFYSPILSHDKTKVAVHKEDFIYIYSIDGRFEPKKIGKGIATEWSADDSHLIGFRDETIDGHSISNSEIYLYNAQSGRSLQLTHTSEKIEMYPSFAAGNQIIYTDEADGQLYSMTYKN